MTARAFNRVSVIGLGYIGLPTAAMFASRKVRRAPGAEGRCKIVKKRKKEVSLGGELFFSEFHREMEPRIFSLQSSFPEKLRFYVLKL